MNDNDRYAELERKARSSSNGHHVHKWVQEDVVLSDGSKVYWCKECPAVFAHGHAYFPTGEIIDEAWLKWHWYDWMEAKRD